jgi:serine/threonine-protein kinase
MAMKPLPDEAVRRLREAVALPDFTGTRYTLLRELGRGGMGAVYLARDAELEREVALKVMHLDDASPELADRMRREARTLARLEHPNIVPIYDLGDLPDGRLYCAMKYVEGPRLDEYARKQHSLPERLRLFALLCEAVAYAHAREVIHRDLKPENIMVGRFGEVLIMDWGLAKPAAEAAQPGLVLGTPHYMAPEQERGEEAGVRADIFSLGRILEFLAGEKPPKPVAGIARKATDDDEALRYSDASELAADVLRFLDGLPVTAYRETLWDSLLRFSRRNRTLLLLVATYVVVRFLIFFWTRI